VQAVQREYAERYLEALGVAPSAAALALVRRRAPLPPAGITVHTRRAGYRRDEARATPAPAGAIQSRLGGRRPADAGDMVRLGAAAALASAAAAGAGAVDRPRCVEQAAGETQPEGQGLFEETVGRALFPFCLERTLRKEDARRRALDVPAVALRTTLGDEQQTPAQATPSLKAEEDKRRSASPSRCGKPLLQAEAPPRSPEPATARRLAMTQRMLSFVATGAPASPLDGTHRPSAVHRSATLQRHLSTRRTNVAAYLLESRFSDAVGAAAPAAEARAVHSRYNSAAIAGAAVSSGKLAAPARESGEAHEGLGRGRRIQFDSDTLHEAAHGEALPPASAALPYGSAAHSGADSDSVDEQDGAWGGKAGGSWGTWKGVTVRPCSTLLKPGFTLCCHCCHRSETVSR
jgi:hypothetical protein